jgi:hypothetical protein
MQSQIGSLPASLFKAVYTGLSALLRIARFHGGASGAIMREKCRVFRIPLARATALTIITLSR